MNNKRKINLTEFYKNYNLILSDILIEQESQEYNACRFQLNKLQIISRKAKITPKKVGQFVTFWKRNSEGITEPFAHTEAFDYYVVDVSKEFRKGQFVFPKSILVEKGIVSTHQKEGKRGFRVYPSWDVATNKQAKKTQKWQLDYFYEISENTSIEKIKRLYQTNNN